MPELHLGLRVLYFVTSFLHILFNDSLPLFSYFILAISFGSIYSCMGSTFPGAIRNGTCLCSVKAM